MTRKQFVSTQNHDYQRIFADSLISTLGVKGAVEACYENQWYGVLGIVAPQKRRSR